MYVFGLINKYKLSSRKLIKYVYKDKSSVKIYNHTIIPSMDQRRCTQL